MSQKNKNSNITWKINTEKIFKKWCDHATCYSWMHDRSFKKYNCHYTWFTVPVIILSTITGTANFAHERYEEYAAAITMVIGAMNILAAIISTIAQFCKVSEKVEGHRVARISWDKFGRNIRVELAKDREDRLNASEFMKYCTEEYNRLTEISPIIPRDVVRQFKKLAMASNVMELNDVEDDIDATSCMCCDECCFCDDIFKFLSCRKCCGNNEKKIERAESKKDDQIELPEICGNFKPPDISSAQKKNVDSVFNKGRYGLFNIEDILIDDPEEN